MSNASRNWKTTLFGVLAAVVGVVQGLKQPTFQSAITDPIAQVSVAAAVIGILAKDSDKVGTTPGTKGAADGAGPGAA